MYDRRVTDAEFIQRVKKYRPSSLLPLVAATSARYPLPEQWLKSPSIKFTPWALAEVARVSIVYGNEHRGLAGDDDVLRCCAAYMSMSDPDLGRSPSMESFFKFMLRMSSEQLGYHHRHLNEFSRTIALFDQTPVEGELQVIKGDWAHELVGCAPAEYVGVAFLLQVGAFVNGGRFSLDWLSQDNFAAVCAEVPASTISSVASDQFIADVGEIRTLNGSLPIGMHPDLRRYSFNPLQSRPVVSGVADDLLIPAANLLTRKVSTSGVYYTGVQRWGNKFAEDVGTLFEAYVGRNLKQMSEAAVVPEIKYGRDKKKSVDWIAIFDNAILLVEVKSTRPTEAVRVASDEAADSIKKSLSRAVEQIENTAILIRERHADFSNIPSDRPVLGLVVTMEPFHVVNARPYSSLLPRCSVPFKVCSAYELEKIVAVVGTTVGSVLLEESGKDDHIDSAVDQLFEGYEIGRNLVVDAGWDALPWRLLEHDGADRVPDGDDGMRS